MHGLSAWFTRNPVAANLLMILVLLAGAFTLFSIRIEGFPAMPVNSITVQTAYPGASAEQVDRGVSRKIENALEGMPGIKKISSISSEANSTVTVKKTSGFDMERFQNEIQSRVDSIFNLPNRAERPVVTRDEFNIMGLIVQVYGDTDEMTLQQTARQVKEDLLCHPKITRIEVFGKKPREIRIEVDMDKLRSHGMTLEEVASTINKASLDYSTGSIESKSGKIVIRADKKAFSFEEFSNIGVRTLGNGTQILVKDVATVVDGFEEEPFFARFQGSPSVGMLIYTGQKGDLLAVNKAAKQVVDKIRPGLPKGIKIDIWAEQATYMKDRLKLLASNAWQGLLIVFLLLALFLNIKLALWVAMGIPISLACALSVMGERFLNYSLNDITTFGMIIVLGILVDDAIVVGESVFEARKETSDPVEGTIKGVHRVTTATVFGCFTTVAAFYPLLLIENEIGKLFASFSVVVIISVMASMLESKLVLPAHLAAISIPHGVSGQPGHRGGVSRLWDRAQQGASRVMAFANTRIYRPMLKITLTHRYAALFFLVTVAVCGISLITNGWIRTVFFPQVPGQIITITLKTRSGSPADLTTAHISLIEKQAQKLNTAAMAELNTDKPPIVRIMTSVTGTNQAEIYAELQPEAHRQLSTIQTLNRWRKRVGTLEGVESLVFSGSFETGGGFILELGAREPSLLKDAVARFEHDLGTINGIYDIRDDFETGKPRMRLLLKPEARHLGLTPSDLASQIGNAFGGLDVQRIQRGTEEVKVVVKSRKDRRKYIRDLLLSRIRTSNGLWVPLSLVADIQSGVEPSAIVRQDKKQVVQVQANLDKDVISENEAMSRIEKDIAPRLKKMYPQLTVKAAGAIEDMAEMKGGMIRALVMILILIYALLAVPLKSYWQPFVIMSVIPFGFVGAVIGHRVMGFDLSVLSFFGMLAVTGVVVNDSLVLLSRFNKVNEAHPDSPTFFQALILSGNSRFRAIVLTTMTTVCGLVPLLSETSEQAQYLIPAAISLAFGELFATPVTLFIVPVLIHIGHDAKRVAGHVTNYRHSR
ncbi:efflux RND transporter permease subunit [uncultured Desulfobacter sp.]|uniref:efflux RND transporter permease subunit n=1 Tax=uncultured Desulfobacter sp. TaxID=240139 RepID=UPI0029F48D48|nr:efflux RND transporter permease subunit [uncultured Desulfobacter sp.]